MRFFVPYDNSDLSRVALRAAYRMAGPLDDVTAMATVIVPPGLPVDICMAEIWQPVFRAEWQLLEAREYARHVARSGATLRCARVQARDRVSAIVAGVAHFHADTLLLARRATAWHGFASLFGDLRSLLREAPCDIHVLYVASGLRTPRYLDHPHDTRRVVRLSTPFQEPSIAAICEGGGAAADTRMDAVIQGVRDARLANKPSL